MRTMSHVFPINNQENEFYTSCQVIKAVSHDAMFEPAALLSENTQRKPTEPKLVFLLLTTVVICCHFFPGERTRWRPSGDKNL